MKVLSSLSLMMLVFGRFSFAGNSVENGGDRDIAESWGSAG